VSLKEILLQLDLLGTIVIIGAMTCFLLDTQWGGVTKSWGSADVVGTLVGFGILTVAFIAIQVFLKERASLPPRIIKSRVVATCCCFVFLWDPSPPNSNQKLTVTQPIWSEFLVHLLYSHLFPGHSRYFGCTERYQKLTIHRRFL
jgi:Fungal trichothecene efflux pump (TRI12)